MSTKRRTDGYRRYPVVKGQCRYCGEPVPKGRRTFCSPECVHEYRVRTDPGYVRQALWKRDHGICAGCGADTDKVRRESWERRYPDRPYPDRWGTAGPWDADHIVPVHLGGGECGLEGFQTLCPDCHKAKTALEAAERARLRRDETESAQLVFEG